MEYNESERKFLGKAQIYDRFRPRYSADFIRYIYETAIVKSGDVIADVGAGTGILSESFAQRNNPVICVEPNIEMLKVAKHRLSKYKNCSFVAAMAENTTLSDCSVDCITVAQAFHWFDRERFKEECKRIIRPDGSVILVWNVTDKSDEINFEVSMVNQELCPNYNGYSNRCEENADEYLSFFRGEIFEEKIFANDLILAEEEFIGRNLSRSYAPNHNNPIYPEYVQKMKRLFKKYSNNGRIIVKNDTRAYIGKV